MSQGSFLYGNTAVYRTEALRGVGGFARELGAFTDGYAMQAVALARGCCFIPERLAVWRRLDSGLARRTVKDVEASLRILDAATARMRREHPHLFPRRYVRRFEARFRFSVARSAVSGDGQPLEKIYRAMGAPTRVDRTVCRLILWVTAGRGKALVPYLFGRLRPFDFWMVLRRETLGQLALQGNRI